MNGQAPAPSALIVVESYWGNTATIGRAVAEALQQGGVGVSIVSAAEAPDVVPGTVAVLVIGAPTHNLGLPSPASRRMAVTRGAAGTGSGVAEWIDRLRLEGSPSIYAFDTHVAGFSGSAAKAIRRRLRTRRIDTRAVEGFLVAGEPPTLRPGEAARATAWGAQLLRS